MIFFCLHGDIWKIIVSEILIKQSSVFHMIFFSKLLNLIGGQETKKVNFCKVFKHLLLKSLTEDEANIRHK